MPLRSNLGNSQTLVEIESIQSNTLILKDGSLRQIIMVGGLNFSLRSEEEQNVVTATFQNFLNSLDFSIQIVVHSRKINIQKYLDDLTQRKSEEPSPLLQNQIEEYVNFVGAFVKEHAIMEKSFFVVVPWHPAVVAKKAAGLASHFMPNKKKEGGDSTTDKPAGVDLAKELPSLAQRVAQVMESLQAIELETILLNDEQLVELFYNLYNPESVERTDVTTSIAEERESTSA